jgi:hypothetical protein
MAYRSGPRAGSSASGSRCMRGLQSGLQEFGATQDGRCFLSTSPHFSLITNGSMDWIDGPSSRESGTSRIFERLFATTRRLVLAIWKSYEQIPAGYVQATISSSVTFYSGVAPERCLKISTAVLSASRCLSNADISNSICAIVAINPSSPTGGATGGSLLGLAGNSSGAAVGSRAAPAPAAVLLRY